MAFPDMQYTKSYGEKVESEIDWEIKKIIKECTLITKGMIKKHEEVIRK